MLREMSISWRASPVRFLLDENVFQPFREGGRRMKNRLENKNPFVEMARSQREEIEKYRWIESERIGHDIGWKRAVTEWRDRYYGKWREHVTRMSVDDQERTETTLVGVVAKPISGRRKRNFSTEHRESIAAAMRAWHEKKKSEST
jgi:hypothetical protein